MLVERLRIVVGPRVGHEVVDGRQRRAEPHARGGRQTRRSGATRGTPSVARSESLRRVDPQHREDDDGRREHDARRHVHDVGDRARDAAASVTCEAHVLEQPERGRPQSRGGQGQWAIGCGCCQWVLSAPRRWAGTPRLTTVSRANFGVDLGIVDGEVEPAALAPARRALDDELRHAWRCSGARGDRASRSTSSSTR